MLYFRANLKTQTHTLMRKIILTLLSSIVLHSYSSAQTYCSVSGTNCNLDDVITNVTIGTINNTTTCGTNGYTLYTTPTATLNLNTGYPISVTVGSGGTEYVAVWIDYDQSGTFDSTEFTSIGSGNGVTINSNITIPGTATPGITVMRVRVRWNTALTDTAACMSYTYGETEDYAITIGGGTACSGTPTAGTASAPTVVCNGVNFNLTLTGYTSGVSGITFQWQSSPTGIPGTYTNITGGTVPNFITSQTATTFYQCIVSCGSNSATSNFVLVGLNDPTACYCAATNGGSSCITNVTLNTLNRTSAGCENSPDYYTSVPVGTATTTVNQGVQYPLSVSIDSSGDAIVSVWIDYNRNGMFESLEWNQIATNALSGSTSTITISIPGSASLGQTGMRIRSRASGNNNDSTDACTSMGSGETEDYIITIGAGTACSGTPTAGTATASVDSACAGQNFNLILTGYTQGVSGLTFQWQSSSTGTTGSFTNITGATTPTYTITQTATTYYQCVVTCSGSSATSTVVSVMSLAALECYCISGATNASDEDIFNVTVGTLNNTSSCTTTGGIASVLNEYSNYAALAAPNLVKGDSVNLSIQIGTCDSAYFYKSAVKVYIDYNQNGSFVEVNEMVYGSDTALGPHTVTGSFTVPLTATNGNTLMRVVCRETQDTSFISACGTYGYGETEDYTVNITGSVGIAENQTLSNVLVYPNPSTGSFNVTVNNVNFNQLSINVIDIQGKVVYSTTDKNLSSNYNKQINLEGLAKGLYYIKLSTESGVKFQKLIVQ